MWGLACTNMFPSTQKDRANVLESQPRRPHPLPSQTPLPPSFQPLSISPSPPPPPPLLPPRITASLSVATSLLSGPLFLIFPLFSPLSPPRRSGPRRPATAVIFPHLRLIPGSGGTYGFICTTPTFYWIPIALERSYRIPNSSRANLIQNS